MGKSKIHVGLEIGSSKTCMVVSESKPDGHAIILGIGEVKSAGVRKGEIVDRALASQCVMDAWNMAQEQANADILAVYLSITGSHIRGELHRGTYRLPGHDHFVSKEHMREVEAIAMDIPLPPDAYIINESKGKYTVDGNDHINHPEGLHANTLDVDYHIVHGIKSRIHNSLSCVRDVPLEVEDMVFAPIATGLSLLNSHQRNAGCLLIDIGGGTTDFCLYKEDEPIVSGCIPVGGDHITNDIHQLTNIPESQAEILKIAEGDTSFNACKALGYAKLPASGVLSEISIPRAELSRIIFERVNETLLLVRDRLPKEDQQGLKGGIFLSGGTSQLRGIGELVGNIFNSSVYQLDNSDMSGVTSYRTDPRFSTAIGTIRYAQLSDQRPIAKPSFFQRIIDKFR